MKGRNRGMKGIGWRIVGPVILLGALLAPNADADEKTERFWQDLLRKYKGQSLVQLLDDVELGLEYTGKVQKVDATAQSDVTSDSRSSARALGSTFTTSQRWTKYYAVLDEVAASRFREWIVPLDAGETAVRTKVEIIDRQGKFVDAPSDPISTRTALPEDADVYGNVRDLVFNLDALPVPCIVRLYYTIEGENEAGHLDYAFTNTIPTYRVNFEYNFFNSQSAQFPHLKDAIQSMRADERMSEFTTNTTSAGTINRYIYKAQNIRPLPVEPYSQPAITTVPRVIVAPNFESDWGLILEWYATEIDKQLKSRADDVVLDPILKETTEGLELADEKIRAIYEYCQQKYDVIDLPIERTGYLPNRPTAIAHLERVTSADLALLMTALLRRAEIEANFALVASTDFGTVNENIKSLSQFNRAVVVADDDGFLFYLDPAEKTASYEDAPASIEGTPLLLVKAGDPEWIDIEYSRSDGNAYSVYTELTLDEESGLVGGKASMSLAGEQNRLFRKKFYGQGPNQASVERENWLAANYPEDTFIDEWQIEKGDHNDEQFRVTFRATYPESFVMKNDDTIELNGLAFGMMGPAQNFAVDPAERKTVVQFPFSESGKQTTRFMIPEGYEVDESTLPESYDVATGPDKSLQLGMEWRAGTDFIDLYDTLAVDDSVEVVPSGDFLTVNFIEYQMAYDLEPQQNRIPVERMNELKKYFEEFRHNQNMKIVLRRVEEDAS